MDPAVCKRAAASAIVAGAAYGYLRLVERADPWLALRASLVALLAHGLASALLLSDACEFCSQDGAREPLLGPQAPAGPSEPPGAHCLSPVEEGREDPEDEDDAPESDAPESESHGAGVGSRVA